jgi:hypothetical protein
LHRNRRQPRTAPAHIVPPLMASPTSTQPTIYQHVEEIRPNNNTDTTPIDPLATQPPRLPYMEDLLRPPIPSHLQPRTPRLHRDHLWTPSVFHLHPTSPSLSPHSITHRTALPTTAIPAMTENWNIPIPPELTIPQQPSPPNTPTFLHHLHPWQLQLFRNHSINRSVIDLLENYPLGFICAGYHDVHVTHSVSCHSGISHLGHFSGISQSPLRQSSPTRSRLSAVYATFLFIERVRTSHAPPKSQSSLMTTPSPSD